MNSRQEIDRREAVRRLCAAGALYGTALSTLSGLSGCQPTRQTATPTAGSSPLDHGFYVWQRAWRPALQEAMQAAQPLVSHWRVLALHLDGTARLHSRIDVDALRRSQRPVHLVVRVEGSQTDVLDDVLIEHIKALRMQWVRQGLNPAGIELDHDVAESQLRPYAAWLSRLRMALPDARLSITALPAWLRGAGLAGLLAVPDEVVLQVHAVHRPTAGLFDARSAQDWISAWAQRHGGPFRLALPCYGSRVVLDEWGQTLAIESETDVALRSSNERELLASPAEAARLMSWLDGHAPAQLQGLMWFRLPTLEDRRSWRLATWQALVTGTRSWAPLQATLSAQPDAGLWAVHLINASGVDQDLPLHVQLPQGAFAFDGEQGYSADLLGPAPRLTRTKGGWLRPHDQLRIGWFRCAHTLQGTHLDIAST